MKRLLSLILAIMLSISAVPAAFAYESSSDTDKGLDVYFLDVGEGDCAVINCDGHVMMIDGGPSGASDKVYSFLKNKGIDRIDYMVATHPDADHIGGLSGALNFATAGIIFCTKDENDTKQFADFKKYVEKQNNSIIIPNAGDIFTLGSAKAEIIAPVKGEELSDNTSLVIKLTYGNTSFLFMGDAEKEDEESLLKSDCNLKCNVIKIGHHGSSSSTTEKLLEAVAPEYAVISVGDNSYGHPTDDVLYRLNQNNISILRTDQSGTITFSSDGKIIKVSTEKNDSAENEKTVVFQSNNNVSSSSDNGSKAIADVHKTDYVVNTNTGKFHYPDCTSVKKMKDANKMYYNGTRDDLISQGYSPCGNCHP